MAQARRSPVVVVLGHVDHGKTSLLDYVRKTNRTAKEYGGITQTIGAYEAHLDIKGYGTNKITFIDTPGHEAFTKLRSRGADVADIAILIVDAVDSVMPQTIESIYHIKNAKLPFIVALNKVDLPGADIRKVKNDLMKHEVVFEDMGGETPALPISAKTGQGVKELLEMILFMADLKELTYKETNPLKAFIIESKMDRSGIIASAIIKDGKLAVGDDIYAHEEHAKVRALINDAGESVREVIPSMPFVISGFKNLPEVGIEITKEPVQVKQEEKAPQAQDMSSFFSEDKKKLLHVVLKADSQGSLDALLAILQKNENIELDLASVGEINKSDIFLAKLSKAIVIGFSVDADRAAKELAEQEKVVIKTYSLIYELLDELQEVSDLIAEKQSKERSLKGEAKVLATFVIGQDRIAGVQMTKGKIAANEEIELYRNERLVGKTKIVSLKNRARDVHEVKKGDEAGMLFYPKLDFNAGDVVKSYSI